MTIAERRLTIVTKTGSTHPVVVRLHAPLADGEIWRCAYEIDWPEADWPAETTRSATEGVDAIHATQLALQKIGLDLYSSSYHREGRMYWVEGRVGYGFIVPKAARDLLVGDDATFYG